MSSQYPTMSPSAVVLVGMGGAGKTQLAIDYCQRLKGTGEVGLIIWIDASSQSSVYHTMVAVAKALFPEGELDNGEKWMSLIKDFLPRYNERWIMVFDGLDNPSELDGILNFFPDEGRGSILVTSRFTGAGELGESIEVHCMEEAEGLEILLRNHVGEEHEAAREILKLLGHLPLAIDQARAYISRWKLPLKLFIERYEGRKKAFLRETPRHWVYRQPLLNAQKGTSLNLSTTWEISLSLLGDEIERREGLRDVLTMFAFFNPVSISEALFDNYWGTEARKTPMSIFKVNGEWDHLEYEKAIVEMQELSLVQLRRRSESEIVVSLHPMVSEWLRVRLEIDSKHDLLETAVFHLRNYLDSTEHNDFGKRQETLQHVNVMMEMRREEEFRINNERLLGIWNFLQQSRNDGNPMSK